MQENSLCTPSTKSTRSSLSPSIASSCISGLKPGAIPQSSILKPFGLSLGRTVHNFKSSGCSLMSSNQLFKSSTSTCTKP